MGDSPLYRNFSARSDDYVIMSAIDLLRPEQLNSVLSDAVSWNRLEIVKYLLDTKHVSPDTIFNEVSMLALALVQNSNANSSGPLILELINRCSPATFAYRQQFADHPAFYLATPLIIAAGTDQTLDTFRQILDKSMGVIDAQNKVGRTALHYVAQHNNIEEAKLLLARGANPLIKDVRGYTAYDVANLGDVKTLLDVKADPSGSPPRQSAAAAAAAAAGAGSPPGPVAPPSPSDILNPQPPPPPAPPRGKGRRTRRKRSKRRTTRARRSIKY